MKPGYKQTEIGVIPLEWDSKKIGDDIDLLTGFPFPSSGYVNAGIRLLRGSNVKRGQTDWTDSITQYWPSITQDISRYELKEGDLVIAMDGSLVGRSFARLCMDDLPAVLLQRVARIRSQKLDVAYLTAFMGSERFIKYAASVKTVTAIPHISPADIRNFVIPMPPTIVEQRAIAEALSAVDELLGGLDRLIAKKRDLKQAAMQKLLTGQTRLPGFHGEWAVKLLGELATIKDGTHQTPRYVQAGVPFYSVEHVTSGDFTNTKFISEEEHKFLTRTAKIEKGDILMTRIGSIGDCKLIDWDVEASFYVSLALLKIRPGYSAPFIAHYSNTAAFKKDVELHSLQSAIPKKINLGPISNVKIELPPTLDEQTAIAALLTDMDKELVALEQRREKTRAVKQGMMQELLTGKTRLVTPAKQVQNREQI